MVSQAEPSLSLQFRLKEYDMRKRKMSTFERLNSGRMPRKQRRELARRVAAADPGLSIVNPHAAGIDVGNASHFAAVPPDRDPLPVREFGFWTADLHKMAEWLVSCRIDTVAMQSTGVYWIPLYDILEKHGLRVVLVNARHTQNVPGRKTDVQECQWLMKLHTYGLLRDSFRLAHNLEGVRTVWRVRGRHVEEAARSVQHMQKALTKMNVQLANVISDVSGLTGQAIVGAILRGERDPHKLAALSDPHIQASQEEIARSLEGTWREDVLFELQQAVDSYQFAHRQIRECDAKLRAYLGSLESRVLEKVEAPAAPPLQPKSRKARKQGANAPPMDLTAELVRICGVDLTSIDGINIIGAMTILSELGPDLRQFKDEDHFTSWLGLTGNQNISGGKRVKGPKRKVNNRVADALRMGATSLLNSNSYLGARYRQLRRNAKIPAVAVKAMARYLAVLVYRLLTKGQAWVDRGAQLFEQQRRERDLTVLQKRAHEHGLQLVPLAAAH
jgi:transposase